MVSTMGSVASVRMMKPGMKNEMDIAPKLWRKFAPVRTRVLRSLIAFNGTMASFFFFLMMSTKTIRAMTETTSNPVLSGVPNFT